VPPQPGGRALSAIAEIVAAPELRELVAEEAKLLLGDHREGLVRERDGLVKEIDDLDRRMEQWATQLTDGQVTIKGFNRVSRKWEADLQRAEDQLAEVERKLQLGDGEDRRLERVMDALDSFGEALARTDARQVRQLLMTMIEEMTLAPEDGSAVTLYLKCQYMPAITRYIPHLRGSLGDKHGPLAKLTPTDLAALALWAEGLSPLEIDEARGLTGGSIYSRVKLIRDKTGMDDLDEIAKLAGPVTEEYREFLPLDGRAAKPDAKRAKNTSGRELEVAQLKAEGLSNREISERLPIVESTVRGVLRRVRNKLGVATTEEALLLLAERGELTDTVTELKLLAEETEDGETDASAADVAEAVAS